MKLQVFSSIAKHILCNNVSVILLPCNENNFKPNVVVRNLNNIKENVNKIISINNWAFKKLDSFL